MKEELTEKMHSEFTIDKETEEKHIAGVVWQLAGMDADKERILKCMSHYPITYEKVMKWKSYWKKFY